MVDKRIVAEVKAWIVRPVVLLGPLAASRDNNFPLIRLAAALAVVLFHSYALLMQSGDDPLTRLTGTGDFGALGVHAFFFVSGFLVTKSWNERHGVLRFAAARVLRIYPALVCATLFSIALGAWSSALPLRDFLASSDALAFARNAVGFSVRDSIAAAFASNPYAGAVNVSLWTLPIELRLYVGLMILGVLGLLAGRMRPTLALAALCAIVVYAPSLFPIEPNMRSTRYFALLFALGMLAYAWRDRIRLSLAVAVCAVALLLWNPGRWTPGPTYCVLLGYILLVVAYHPRLHLRWVSRMGDYSYGIYVYSFPVQQAVIQMLPGYRTPLLVLLLSLPPIVLVAAASWHLVEQPCLALKRRRTGRMIVA